jgi:hypothetical protein
MGETRAGSLHRFRLVRQNGSVSRAPATRIGLLVAAAMLLIVWNIWVFSLYAFATIPISFAIVVFTMIAITVIRSSGGDRRSGSRIE